MTETRKIAAILAADVVGFSRMASADEDGTLARLRTLRSELIDPAVTSQYGRVFKRTGDGALVEFRSVVEAVRCAIQIQSAMVERNADVPEDRRIKFRIGIHLGDVVEESDGDLMGDGVNIAARLESIAAPGAICLSEDAYRQVKSRLDMKVSDLGPTALKNISEPVRVYSVEVGKDAGTRRATPARRGRLTPVLAVLAGLVGGVGAAAWYFVGGKVSAPTAASSPMPMVSSFGPAIGVLPFANASGDAKHDALTQRVGQKTRDYLGNATTWRVVGGSGGTVGSVADPLEAGRRLNADYAITGNLEAGGDTFRVTFQLDDVHSGARLWSRTLSPILETGSTAEDEVAGRADTLLGTAILDAERARLAAAGEIQKTTWGCVLLAFGSVQPDTVASTRDCLEAAARREPSNPNVWLALATVIEQQRLWGWGLPAEEASVAKRARLADRQLQAGLRARDLAPSNGWAQYWVTAGYYATCQPERVQVETEKTRALNPDNPDMVGGLGLYLAFTGHWDEGSALAEKAIKLAGPSASPWWWWPTAKRHWLRGEYPEAYEAFQHSYYESFWLSHLDLAYTLPFLGRLEEAKAHVAELLKMYPSMTIREADAFYKLVCFDAAYREKMAGALRQAGLPE
jgi:adenylate cyclase